MKLAIALAVLLSLSATTAMACTYDKAAQNAPPTTSQQASSQGTQGTSTTQQPTRTN